MRKSRFNEEQIALALRQVDAGAAGCGAVPEARHR
jgi:hypothetical protein